MTSPEGDHAANDLVEIGVREIKAQTILRSQLEQRLGSRIDEKGPLALWIPQRASNCVSRDRLVDGGRTLDQRRCGKTWKRPLVEFGESLHLRPVGENNATQCEAETKGCCVVSLWAITRDPVPQSSSLGNDDGEHVGAREMGSRVRCNVYRSSMATEAGSAEADKSRSRCCTADRDARCSESRSEELRHKARSREEWIHRRVSSSMQLAAQREGSSRRWMPRSHWQAHGGRASVVTRSPEVESPRPEAGEEMDIGDRRSVWMCHQSNQLPRVKRVDFFEALFQVQEQLT